MTTLKEPSNTLTVVGDIEANGLYQTADKVWCGSFKTLGEDIWNEFGKDQINQMLEYMSTVDRFIFHNGINYDFPLLKKLYGWEPKEGCEIIDTLVMSRLFNPDRGKPPGYTGKGGPHSMECWGFRLGAAKVENENWEEYTPILQERCKQDVVILERTYHSLSGESVGHDWSEALEMEHEMARIMTEQEHHGILFDKDKAEEYVKWLSDRIGEIDAEIVPRLPGKVRQIGSVPVNNPFLKTGGYRKQTQEYLDGTYPVHVHKDLIGGPFTRIEFLPFDLGSTETVKSYLLASGWEPDNWNYSKKTGERTSPKLEGDFRGVDGDIPRRVKERITWRHRRSQIEGWLERLRPDGRLSAGANPCGTNTGRMRHHTVVNIPKANTDKNTGKLIWDTSLQKDIFGTQMRALFCCPEEYKIVGHDASGLELRMLAHYMGDDNYIEQILHGDIHEYNRAAAGLPNRDAAKTFIYAFNYGAGDKKLGSIVGGDATDGAELRAKFLDSVPKLEKLINSVKRASGKGYLKGLDSRRIMMRQDSRGRIARHKALNTLLQGSGAIVMKESALLLDQYVRENEIRGYKVLDYHDEAQWEILKEDVDKYVPLAVASIVDAGTHFNLNIPLAAEAKIGTNLAETH